MTFLRLSFFLLFMSLHLMTQGQDLYFTTYICTQGSFKVDFPGIPNYRSEQVKLANLELQNHYFDLRDFMADTVFFTLRYTDYPADKLNSSMKSKMIEAFFEDSRNEFIKSMDGRELDFSRIEFKDYPGYALKVEVGDKKSVVTKHLLLIENRVYILKAFTPVDNHRQNIVDRFLHSFELLSSIANEEPYNYLLEHNVPQPLLVDTVITFDPHTLEQDLMVVNHYTKWSTSITSGKEIFNTDQGQKIVDYYIDRGEKKVKSISRSTEY